MIQYVSMWDSKELSGMNRHEAHRRVGIKQDNTIVQAPICRKCGSGCIEVDLGTKYLQCLDCGHTEEAHYYNKSGFRGEI